MARILSLPVFENIFKCHNDCVVLETGAGLSKNCISIIIARNKIHVHILQQRDGKVPSHVSIKCSCCGNAKDGTTEYVAVTVAIVDDVGARDDCV